MDHRRRFSAFVAKGQDKGAAVVNALKFTREFLLRANVGERAQTKTVVLVEELISNTLRHGGAERDVSLWLSLGEQEGGVEIALVDDAPPFDPSAAIEFSGPNPVTGGGIGLAIVRAWGENIDYSRSKSRNHLRLTVR